MLCYPRSTLLKYGLTYICIYIYMYMYICIAFSIELRLRVSRSICSLANYVVGYQLGKSNVLTNFNDCLYQGRGNIAVGTNTL